jgi:glyoxylase-like metal-dependent hydrolase (beta-lactamase superfamily II)
MCSGKKLSMKRLIGRLLAQLLFVATLGAGIANANPFEYKWQQLAPGVWAGIREDPFELPQEGNTVFVVTDEGVVLFDAGGSPAMGESIVAKVRSLTDKPITHVVISHWHGDHMRGLQAIKAAFPKVQIFTHPHTREFIESTKDKWLKRRVNMVPGIRKAVSSSLANDQDLSGRPLITAEKEWLQKGLAITDQLDKENNRTAYTIPDATFVDQLTLFVGGKEIRFLCLGKSHTAGDIIMWLPGDKIVATGDIVTSPVPLMPSAYTRDYPEVLERIKALGFSSLVPGHGAVAIDSQYLDLLAETVQSVSLQMKQLVGRGLSEEEAVKQVDFSKVEYRFTHGDGFLKNRFEDYVKGALPKAAYIDETGKGPKEIF